MPQRKRNSTPLAAPMTSNYYYDMTPPPGRASRTRKELKQAEQSNDIIAGIGTKSCFSFRPPRTITTTNMSHDEDDMSHPSDEVRVGLLKAAEPAGIKGNWNSPSDETAEMTATTRASPSMSSFISSPTDSLLSMPTPRDRSHRARLKMEREGGGTLKYDGEQEPAGYRGQAATPSTVQRPRAISKDGNLLAMPTPTDRSHRARLKMEREGGGTQKYDGEQEPAGYRGQEATPSPVQRPRAVSKDGNLLAMPAPTDRSHRRRQKMERDRRGNTYDGEQAPQGYRDQEGTRGSLNKSKLPVRSFKKEGRRRNNTYEWEEEGLIVPSTSFKQEGRIRSGSYEWEEGLGDISPVTASPEESDREANLQGMHMARDRSRRPREGHRSSDKGEAEHSDYRGQEGSASPRNPRHEPSGSSGQRASVNRHEPNGSSGQRASVNTRNERQPSRESTDMHLATPIDLGFRRRLEMERENRGVSHEQDPAGLRISQVRQTPNKPLTSGLVRKVKPPSNDSSRPRKLEPERGRNIASYEPEQDAPAYAGQSPTQKSPVLLSMPTPKDRSHRRRLRMEEEGMGNTYDGEQVPVGYRGKDPSEAPRHKVTETRRANLLVMPVVNDRSSRRRSNADDEQPGLTGGVRSRMMITPESSPEENIRQIAMPSPSPTYRSSPLRLEEGRSITYKDEVRPLRYRRQEESPTTPKVRAKALDLLAMPNPSDRSHRKRPQQEREGEAVKSSSEQEFDKHSEEARGKEPPPTGTPYLQFSTDGPALRVFDSSPPRSRSDAEFLVSPNSSMLVSDNSAADDDCVLSRAPHAVPRSQSAEDKIKQRKAVQKQVMQRAVNRKQKSILRTPSRHSGYSTATTVDTTPERQALAVMRGTPPDDDHSYASNSTESSANLDMMRTDLLEEDDQSMMSSRASPSTAGSLPAVNEMAASAQMHVEQGEYDLALVLFGRILAIYRKKYGDKHPLVASAYHNLGMVHSQRAALLLDATLQQSHVRQQSLECFQAAARTARDTLGKNHPNVAVSLVKIGFLLLQARQYEPAKVTFEEALRIRLHHYGQNPHTLISNLYSNLGVVKMHLQKFSDSKLDLMKALEIQRHLLRVERMKCGREELRIRLLEVADTLANLGGLGLEWLRQEGPDEDIMWEAEGQLAEALEIRSTVLGHDHPLAIQVKSLHDMVRSTPALVRGAKAPKSSARAITPFHNDESAASKLGTERTLTVHVSPTKSLNSSLDAPAPIAFSPSPTEEYSQERFIPPLANNRPASPLQSHDDGPSFQQLSLSSVPGEKEEVQLTAPVSEVIVGKDSPTRDPPSRLVSPEKTKIFVAPHYIPRQSPSKAPRDVEESYYTDPKTPILSSSASESSDPRLSNRQGYEAEESCLINESGDRIDLLSRFLIQTDDADESEVNLSSHEIMVVRPCAMSSMSRKAPAPLMQPLSETFESIKKKHSLDENDDGIAPLSGMDENHSDPTVLLSEQMLENPEYHLVDIHAAASRYLKKNRLLEARHLFIVVLDSQRRIHGELHEDVGAAMHNVGLAHLRSNDHEQAVGYFQRAARVRKGSLGREHPEVAVSLVKVGISLLLMRNFDMSLQAFMEALSIRKRAMGALHPSIANIYVNIGCLHVEFNELRDARRAFEAALDIQRNGLCHKPDSGPLKFGAATTLCNLGYLYRYRQMHQKAALVLKEALSLQEAVLGKLHPTVLATTDSLADALSLSGGCAQALRYYSSILARFKDVETMSNRRQAEAIVLYKMSRAHCKQNDKEAEMLKLQRALRAVRATIANSVPDMKRKEQLEEQILIDLERAKGVYQEEELEWI